MREMDGNRHVEEGKQGKRDSWAGKRVREMERNKYVEGGKQRKIGIGGQESE